MTQLFAPKGAPATLDPDLGEVIVEAIKAALYDTHTGLPAKVVSFDPATQSCVVQPLIKSRILDDDERVEIISKPPVFNVPIVYPAGGGWSITWPLAIDDIVFLAFAERSIDAWLQAPAGVEVDAVDARKHALSDAIAIPGLRPRVGAIAGISLTDFRISNTAGTVALTFGADAVNITAPLVNVNSGGVAASQHMVLGEALIALFNAHTHPVTTTGTASAQAGTSGPPVPTATPSLLSASALVAP